MFGLFRRVHPELVHLPAACDVQRQKLQKLQTDSSAFLVALLKAQETFVQLGESLQHCFDLNSEQLPPWWSQFASISASNKDSLNKPLNQWRIESDGFLREVDRTSRLIDDSLKVKSVLDEHLFRKASCTVDISLEPVESVSPKSHDASVWTAQQENDLLQVKNDFLRTNDLLEKQRVELREFERSLFSSIRTRALDQYLDELQQILAPILSDKTATPSRSRRRSVVLPSAATAVTSNNSTSHCTVDAAAEFQLLRSPAADDSRDVDIIQLTKHLALAVQQLEAEQRHRKALEQQLESRAITPVVMSTRKIDRSSMPTDA